MWRAGELDRRILPEFAGARIVALADVMRDRLMPRRPASSGCGARILWPGRPIAGDRIEVDAVAIESPPYFHPEQVLCGS